MSWTNTSSEVAKESLRRRALIRLMVTGYFQVLLVAINVYQISHGHVLGAIIIGFGISLTWTFNIKSVAFGGWTERLIYAGAAAAGTLTGMLIPDFIYSN